MKKKSKLSYIYLFNIIIALLIALLLFFFINNILNYQEKIGNDLYSLKTDGVVVIQNVFNNEEIQHLIKLCSNKSYQKTKEYLLQHENLKNVCSNQTSAEYVFQDYIWIIQKSVVHTCHRDNNGDFFNKEQQHPSYTVLVYLEPMEKCLGVIPKSHFYVNSFNVNFTDKVIHLPCNPGDIIMFNANLIHVGAINKKQDSLRCQLKFSHKDDIPILDYYQNYNKVLNETNHLPLGLRQMQKQFSCSLPILSNLTQSENIRTARGSDNGVNIGYFQKFFSLLFYGNSNFYDLPNAF
jgi:ectoine hydroxylase-related dioxygenase (phytanoyl-CoA dioxygenase family)